MINYQKVYHKFSKKQQAILGLILANIIWGAASPIFKWSLTNIAPFTLAYLRFLIASLIFLIFYKKFLPIEKKDWIKVVLIGITGVFLNITFFFFGLKTSSAINAPIIATAGPIFVLTGAVLFLKEHPRPRLILGLIIALIGVITIVIQPILIQGTDASFWGNLLFILATLAAVSHTLFAKEPLKKYGAQTITFWTFFIGSVSFFPFAFWEWQANPDWLLQIDIRGAIGILFGAFLSSALAYFLWHRGLEVLETSETQVFVYLDPVAAIILAWFLLGETPTFIYLFGSALVFLGIWTAERRIAYHPLFKLKKV